jgi:hypothetical protein
VSGIGTTNNIIVPMSASLVLPARLSAAVVDRRSPRVQHRLLDVLRGARARPFAAFPRACRPPGVPHTPILGSWQQRPTRARRAALRALNAARTRRLR